MKVQDWIRNQFSEHRMLRYLDGCNPTSSGNRSFFQILTWKSPIQIWSVVHVTKPDRTRGVYYLKGEALHSQDKDFAIGLKMRANGMSWENAVVSTVHFSVDDNAPKKLNQEIRKLRIKLGI